MEQNAKRALEAFLRLTVGNSEGELALRALVLHMLEGYSPQAFNRWNLNALLQKSIHRLTELNGTFPKELPPDDGLARVDAIYLLRERNLTYELPHADDFLNYMIHLNQNGFGLYGWLMSELMKRCGLDIPIIFADRPYKSISPMHDLYWVTHLFFLDTRYLQGPLHNRNASEWTKDLLAATAWVIDEQRFDLAAEIAICLQLTDQTQSDAYRMILNALVRRQQIDGSLQDLTLGVTTKDEVAHTTGACLLVFAEAEPCVYY